MEFDRCVKMKGNPRIWLIKGRSRLLLKRWEDYVALGKPPHELITEEELARYREVSYFRSEAGHGNP